MSELIGDERSEIMVQRLAPGVLDVLVKNPNTRVCLEFLTVLPSDVIKACCPKHQRSGFAVDVIFEQEDRIVRERVLDLTVDDAKALLKELNREVNRLDPFWMHMVDKTPH
tara:strand:+ start:179 stop:511 length:333 start_codon:yes stop_codon:yes gene_type:complete